MARTIVTQRPEVDRAKFFLGIAIHKQKRYGLARPILEAAAQSTQEFPERGHVPHFLGWCCYYSGDLKAARHYFELHASNWPNFDDTFYGLGVLALDEDRLSDAETAFNTALRIQKEGAPEQQDQRAIAKTLARLGDISMRHDQFDAAIERYEHAVQLWPDHYEAWARLVRLYNRAGREADATRAGEREEVARKNMGRSEPIEEGMPAATSEPTAPGAEPTSEPVSEPTKSVAPPSGTPASKGAAHEPVGSE